MKKFFIGMLTAATIMFQSPITFAEFEGEVPEEIYKWIQSTPRGNYWFNFQVCGYKIKDDDTLDLNILEVPLFVTYDNIQIEDVIQKRRWRMQSTKGYNDLIGRADYLEFNLIRETVQIVKRDDLDHTFSTLDSYTVGDPIKLAELDKRDVSYKTYHEILKWIQENNEWVIKRSDGKLSQKDAKIKQEAMPIFKLRFLKK